MGLAWNRKTWLSRQIVMSPVGVLPERLLENKIFNSIKKPPIYLRYVDDILILTNNINEINNSSAFKKHLCPTTQLRKILTDNTTILGRQNDKQKLQILEALHIRNLQPTLIN